jgi:hypothetical protein
MHLTAVHKYFFTFKFHLPKRLSSETTIHSLICLSGLGVLEFKLKHKSHFTSTVDFNVFN